MKVKVCAAVIRKNGRTLICSRPKATVLGDKMEFPGGKVEPGESLNECIRRELREELNADVLPMDVIHRTEAVYPDKTVELFFIRCMLTDQSSLKPLDGQEFRWAETALLDREDFLPADLPFAELLAKYASPEKRD